MDLSIYDLDTQKLIEECEKATVEGDKGAVSLLRRLKKVALEIEDSALLGFVYFFYANWYYDHSRYGKFQVCLGRAIRELLRSTAYDLLSRCYNFFAIDAQSNDAMDVAYSYYNSALKFADEKSSPASAGVVIHNLAVFYCEVGDYEKAREFFRRSIRLQTENRDSLFYDRNITVSYINEGTTSLSMKDVAAAEEAYEKTKELLKDNSDNTFADLILSFRIFEMRLALAKGDIDRIDQQVEDILSISGEVSPSLLEIEDIKWFCYDLMDRGLLSEAEKILEVITPTVEDSGMIHSMRMLMEIKVELYDRSGDDKKMIEALRAQHRLILRQKEEQARIYKYSMNLINLVGELKEEEEKVRLENENLQEQIVTDYLTGIPNRYAMDQHLNRVFDNAYASGGNLGVAIIDVDDFKSYNDRYGHQAGDECLEKIGRVMKDVSRREGIFCARYGGDEFVVIFVGKSDEEIVRIARTIAGRVDVIISQGVCNDIPKNKNKPWDFLSAADQAMYTVKREKEKLIPIVKLPRFA